MKKSFFFGLTAVFIWSTIAAVLKGVVTALPNMEVLSLSGLIASVFLFIVNAVKGRLYKLALYQPKDYLRLAGMGFLGMFLYSFFYFLGLEQLSSQEACILNYFWPAVLVAFSAVILKEKMTAIKIIAMICSFIGVVILSYSGRNIGVSRLFGIFCCVLSAVFYGLFSVLNKKADYDQGLAMTFFWFTTGVCSAVIGMATETWVPLTHAALSGILWVGIMGNACAYLLWALALKGTDNTAAISNLAYLTPFLSLLVSYLLLGEMIQPRALIALVFIVGGILIQNVRFYQREES